MAGSQDHWCGLCIASAIGSKVAQSRSRNGDGKRSQWKANALDRLVAAGTIREIDRERVRFIVRCIVQPPERPDDSHGRLLTGKEGVG